MRIQFSNCHSAQVTFFLFFLMAKRMTSHISPLRSLVSREMLFITCSVHGLGAFDKKALF